MYVQTKRFWVTRFNDHAKQEKVVVAPTVYKKFFMGKSILNATTEYSGAHDNERFDGNSLLFELCSKYPAIHGAPRAKRRRARSWRGGCGSLVWVPREAAAGRGARCRSTAAVCYRGSHEGLLHRMKNEVVLNEVLLKL